MIIKKVVPVQGDMTVATGATPHSTHRDGMTTEINIMGTISKAASARPKTVMAKKSLI